MSLILGIPDGPWGSCLVACVPLGNKGWPENHQSRPARLSRSGRVGPPSDPCRHLLLAEFLEGCAACGDEAVAVVLRQLCQLFGLAHLHDQVWRPFPLCPNFFRRIIQSKSILECKAAAQGSDKEAIRKLQPSFFPLHWCDSSSEIDP